MSHTAKRVTVAVIAVVIVAVAAVMAIRTWGSDPGDADATEPSSSSPASQTPTDDPSTSTPSGAGTTEPTEIPSDPADIDDADRQMVEAEANHAFDVVVPVISEIDPDEQIDLASELADVVAGAYLSELEAERLEFESEGMSRTGTYEFGEPEVLEYEEGADATTALVRVCVDSSNLVVYNADGDEVSGQSASRVWNVFALQSRADGAGWQIIGHTFPNDPTC